MLENQELMEVFAQGRGTLEYKHSEVTRSCPRIKMDWRKQLPGAGRAKAGGSFIRKQRRESLVKG